MSRGESISALMGRWIIAWLFLALTYRYASDWNDTTILLAMKGVPSAPLALLAGLIMNVLGSTSLLLGFHTRTGALALFVVTIASTMTVYDYWNLSEPIAREADFDLFARNIGIAGGLLLLIGMGPGKFAFDNRTSPASHAW
jgi:putative oxidoreductase